MMNLNTFGRKQSRHLPRETEENHEKYVSVAGFRAEIWIPDPPNTKQACQSLGYNVPRSSVRFRPFQEGVHDVEFYKPRSCQFL
jgi:hypothetical protein